MASARLLSQFGNVEANSVPAVFNSESQVASFIRARIAKGTVVHADEAASWDNLHERFEIKRINHQEAYRLNGACANMVEKYFSRLRRAEIGIHHHIAGAYLLSYAQESSWREDDRRVSNRDQVNRITAPVLKRRGLGYPPNQPSGNGISGQALPLSFAGSPSSTAFLDGSELSGGMTSTGRSLLRQRRIRTSRTMSAPLKKRRLFTFFITVLQALVIQVFSSPPHSPAPR
jgi:hypothetical protein